MDSGKKRVLGVNLMFWVVAALLGPIAEMLPTGTGETPKIFSLLIPLAFLGLAFGSCTLLWRAMSDSKADPSK